MQLCPWPSYDQSRYLAAGGVRAAERGERFTCQPNDFNGSFDSAAVVLVDLFERRWIAFFQFGQQRA